VFFRCVKDDKMPWYIHIAGLIIGLLLLIQEGHGLSATNICIQQLGGECITPHSLCPQTRRISVCDDPQAVCCKKESSATSTAAWTGPPPIHRNESVPLYDMACTGNILGHVGELWTYTGLNGDVLALVPQFYPRYFDCQRMTEVVHTTAPIVLNVSVSLAPHVAKSLGPDGVFLPENGGHVLTDSHTPMLFSPPIAQGTGCQTLRGLVVSLWVRLSNTRAALLMAGDESLACTDPIQSNPTACTLNKHPLRQYHYSADNDWPCQMDLYPACHFICPRASGLSEELSTLGLCLESDACSAQGGYFVGTGGACSNSDMTTSSCTQAGCCLYRPPFLSVPMESFAAAATTTHPSTISQSSSVPASHSSSTSSLEASSTVSSATAATGGSRSSTSLLPYEVENLTASSILSSGGNQSRVEEFMAATFGLLDLTTWIMVLSGLCLALCLAAFVFQLVRCMLRRRKQQQFQKIDMTQFVDLGHNDNQSVQLDEDQQHSASSSTQSPTLQPLRQEIEDAISESGDYAPDKIYTHRSVSVRDDRKNQ
jgi:hypothetical protein